MQVEAKRTDLGQRVRTMATEASVAVQSVRASLGVAQGYVRRAEGAVLAVQPVAAKGGVKAAAAATAGAGAG